MTADHRAGQKPQTRATSRPRPDRRDEALRRAVRLEVVQELADEMAHDLNNVLTVIAGSLQLYLMQQGGETPQHHFVRNAIEASLRGAQMTGNLLAYASPQVLEVREIDLFAVVQGVVPLLRECLGSADALEIEPPTDPLWVMADSRFIESALLALGQLVAGSGPQEPRKLKLSFNVLNARSAGQRSGAVRADGNFIELNVGSVSAGVTADLIRQALTPAFGGTPAARPLLDLSAAYASVRQCGGDIGVVGVAAETGEPTDGGCLISVLLPAVDRR
jgi:signal transduction histidine kinase